MRCLAAKLLPLAVLMLWGYRTKAGFSQEKSNSFDAKVEQAKYPNSEVVYLLDEGKLELKEDGTSTGRFHVRLKILNARGLDHKSLQLLGGKSKKVTNFDGKVIKPDGKERKVKPEEIIDASYNSKNRVYQDVKVKSIRFREVSVGCILDYEYEIKYDSFIDLPDWVFDGVNPAEQSIFSLQFSPNVKFFFSNLNTDSTITFEKQIKEGDSIFVWTAHHLPPIAIEPNMPNFRSLQKRVLFWTPDIRFQGKTVSFASWGGVVNWFLERARGKLNIGRKVFDKIPAYLLARNDEAKAKAIYQFVQDGFRYIDVALGEGEYEPNDANTILRRRYGDRKDFAFVLYALLRIANIEAYPVLLRTRDLGPIVEPVITLRQFDHIIVMAKINGDTLYMDPTYATCPFKLLPPYAQDSYALILKGGNTSFQKTPVFSAALSDFRQMYEIDFDSSGAAVVQGKVFANGLVGDAFKTLAKIGTKKEIIRWVGDYFNSHVPGIKLLRQSFTSIRSKTQKQDSSQAYVAGDFVFKCDNFFSPKEGLIFLTPNLLNKTRVPVFAINSEDERIHPVVFGNKFVEFDKVTIRIPQGYEAFFIPALEAMEEEFAVFRSSYMKGEDAISLLRWFELKALRVEKKDYKTLQEFYRRVAQADKTEIIFRKQQK